MKTAASFVCALVVFSVWSSTPAAQSTDVAIALGNRHAVALKSNGDVLTWGENVYCQLGRASKGNSGRTPEIVMRNGKVIAAAADHTLVLTGDGKVYGWGMNPEGALGTGNTNDQCEGPALIESLAGHAVTKIATGAGFSVAVTSTGDLFCSGDNGMGQCPVLKSGDVQVFTKVSIPELAGRVADVEAGAFHALILTTDQKLYALGRGRDGQLGHGKTVNGFAVVPDMTDVVSFSAGTWHSVAARADGSAWAWGNDAKSQLCDGLTANRATPSRIAVPGGAKITHVAAGGHGTLLRTADGQLLACGDNQFGPLGVAEPLALQPTRVAVPAISPLLAISGANAAISTDGCDVRLAGQNDHGIVSSADSPAAKAFTTRAGLSLCAPRSASALPSVVNPAPKGGLSGCWTTRKEEDSAASPRFAGLRKAMLAAEDIVKKNAAFIAAPLPVRYRTSLSAGPLDDSGARMHVTAFPERKSDGTRVWAGTTGCEVIPQVDRIGGSIAQVSIFFNEDARGQFINGVGQGPKLTGTVAGYPEYNNWVVITKNGRLPWIPQTLAELLDQEGAKREKALAEARRRPGAVPDDAAGGATWLEKQVRDYQQYRASFSAEQLRAPGVFGDPTGAGRKRLDAEIAAIRAGEGAPKTREERQAMMARTAPVILDKMAHYELTNLQPGTADRAMRAKRDPSFPDPSTPNRVQVIVVLFSFGPRPAGAQLEWQAKVKETFDFAALAALLQ